LPRTSRWSTCVRKDGGHFIGAEAVRGESCTPLADQFYGERGGRLRDPFGQEWMLSTRLENLTATEIAARATAQP
jgi:uncharacterized glyoxalase superfamily protein PhnB